MSMPSIYSRKYCLLGMLMLISIAGMTQRQTLLQVLQELNTRKGVFFLYGEGNMSERVVNPVQDYSAETETILTQVLKNTGLNHKKVAANTYVIINASATDKHSNDYIGADIPVSGNAQSNVIIVTGKVVDETNMPLAGVSVRIKGSRQGASSNTKGNFFLEASRGDILIVSSVGYSPVESRVFNNQPINIKLSLIENEMTEVVVTALGIRKETRQLGFAVTSASGGDFTKAREVNFGNALVGRVAGLNSSSPLTGPGGSSRVTIRGNSSLSFDNQPLYVINGIPMNNDNLGSAGKFGGADFGDGVCSINADDIDEITVLKGSAAAALYGQRGRNGVILITTKSGKGRKALGIELNSNLMADVINDFTHFQHDYGQGFEGIKPTDQTSALRSGLYSWGAKLDGSAVTLFDGLTHPYSYVSKNNLKDFYQTGLTFTNTISISGGNDAGNFRVSFGDLRNNSVYPNTKYNRHNINVDLNYRVSEKWSGQVNATYVKEIGKNRSNLSDAPGNGNFAIAILPPNVAAKYLAPGYDVAGNETQYNDLAFNTNPYFAAAKFENNTGRDRLLGMANIRFTPSADVYFQARIANDFFSFNASSITPTGTAYKPNGTINLQRSYDYNETNADLLAGYTRKLRTDLKLDVTLGASLLKMNSSVLDVSADGLVFPFLYNPGTATSQNINVTKPRKEVQSIYGAAELSYLNRLYLTITDRHDWSSTLPESKNSYNYPSFTTSFVFPDKLRPKWIDFARMRAGYAQVGGDAPIFATALYYNIIGGINGAPIGNLDNQIPNQGLAPLKVKELEIGGEIKALKNRFYLDIAWYHKRTINDIVAATTSITSGFSSALVNMGTIDNRGIELLVGGTPLKTKSFSWSTSFNYANNRNTVVRLAEGQTSMQVQNGQSRTERGFIQHVVGKPFSQVMVYDIRRNEKGQAVLGVNGLQPGDNLSAAGTGVHPITGGWSNDFSYKNFSLSLLIDFKSGAVLYSGTNATATQRGLTQQTLNGRENGINLSGVDDNSNEISRNVSAQQYFDELYSISSFHVYDASFIKFRSFSLTYDIPTKLLKDKVAGLSIALVGRNLLYLKRNTPNIDPEANYSNSNAQGLEYAALPSVRSYGLNVHVKF